MHLLLTDHLICPRCESESGLILLAESMSDRLVETGALGCPQCRSQYPIRNGIADLRSNGEAQPIATVALDKEGVTRLAALIGITEGPAFVLTIGLSIESAAELASVVPGLQVVSAGTEEVAGASGVNRILVDRGIPVRSGGVNGVAVTVSVSSELILDLTRVLSATGRMVLTAADDAVVETLAAAGMRIIAREGTTAVAVMRPDRGAGLAGRN